VRGADLGRAAVRVVRGGAGPDEGALIVLVFADVKSWKCRAGLSAENARRLADLGRDAAVVVLFGHERRIADVPGTSPVVCAWSGDAVMQRAAAQRLLAG